MMAISGSARAWMKIAVSIAMGATIACARSGEGNLGSVVAPTALAGSSSTTLGTLARPITSYDGSGVWSGYGRDVSNRFHPEFIVINFTQDVNGNLSFDCGPDCGVIQLTRTSPAGPIISYTMTITGAGTRACISQTGSARITTSATPNTLSGTVSGQNFTGSGCAQETDSFSLTKQ